VVDRDRSTSENDPRRIQLSSNEIIVSFGREDASATAIADILQRISSGDSTAKDDARLVEVIKKEIARTADETKTPAGSIEAAATMAQLLLSELTSAYTSAIYESESEEEGRDSFARFRSTVRDIVDFVKNGHFLTSA